MPYPQQFDFLIIGGGSAGCVLANRLSADPKVTVGLVEAGPDTPPEEVPASIQSGEYLPDYFDPSRYWTDLTVYRDAIGNRSAAEIEAQMTPVRYEQARVMGGGSSVNGQVALRGIPDDYDGWERMGADGWGWADCLPYFRRLERDMDFGGPMHGRDGPIPIRRTFPTDWGGFALAFREAAAQAGLPYYDDANGVPDSGCFPSPRNNVYDRRITTAVGYLDNVTRQRPNLHIIPNTMVDRIEFRGTTAIGAQVQVNGKTRSLSAREIIVSAGAIHSPTLLMRSGVGPKEDLQALGIPVVCDSPGVGANLQDHPLVGVGIHLTPAGRMRPAVRNPFVIYTRFSSGMDECPTQDMKISLANRFDSSPIGQHFGVVRVGPDRAFSRGFVKLKSTRPEDEPLVAFNLLADSRDLARMREGVRFVYRLVTSAAMKGVVHDVFAGAYTNWLRLLQNGGRLSDIVMKAGALGLDSGPFMRSAIMKMAFPRGADIHAMAADDQLLDDWIRETVLGNWHACGTCRMGSSQDRLAVVAPDARVKGVQGLRVADSSIMPSIPCANINLTTIMIGEKVSAQIAENT